MRARIKNILNINWFATLKLNLKVVPLKELFKCPILVYRGFSINEFKGEIIFNAPIQFGILVFGQPYEIFTRSGCKGEAVINGQLIINGRVQFGIDTKLYIKQNGILSLGHINSFAARTEVICFKKIVLEDWIQFGNDCLICDTNFHNLKDISTNEILPMNKEILIRSHNFIGARTTIKGNTITPENCLVATNSLLNKNYTSLGEHILIGGIPAWKIKDNISRDWETEKEVLLDYLTIKL